MRPLLAFALVASVSGCTAGLPTSSTTRPQGDDAAQAERSDRELILDALLLDVVNNPDLKDTSEAYGTPGEKRIALVTAAHGVPWPADYRPRLPGWAVSRLEKGAKRDTDKPRLLGVRIDEWGRVGKEGTDLPQARIAVTILNAGGDKNGAIMGGCSVFYTARRAGGKWVVDLEELSDP